MKSFGTSLLDINENSLNHTDVIKCAIKKFLSEFRPHRTNERIVVDGKCYLLSNKDRKEIEYGFDPEQYWLMSDLDYNVFAAKLIPNWTAGNKGVWMMSGYHKGSYLVRVSLDYILTNYGF
jgi:hypothetical protein